VSARNTLTILALPPMRDPMPIPPPTRQQPGQLARIDRKMDQARRNYWKIIRRHGWKKQMRRSSKWEHVMSRLRLCDLHCGTRRDNAHEIGTGAILCAPCHAALALCACCSEVAASLDRTFCCEQCSCEPVMRWRIVA